MLESTRLRDPHHLEIVREARKARRPDPRPFDRVAYASRVLALLQPPKWSVALYVRDDEFHLERVRDLRYGPDAVWAVVGIPAHATRAEIAVTIAQLTGAGDLPFLVDLAVADESSPV